MKLDGFFKFLVKLPVDDYVVRLKLKYDDEKDYRYTNEILVFEGDNYVWANDWDEGEHDVEVLGYIPVSEIITFRIPIADVNHTRHCKNCEHLIFRDYKHNEGLCIITRLHRCFTDICLHEEEMT